VGWGARAAKEKGEKGTALAKRGKTSFERSVMKKHKYFARAGLKRRGRKESSELGATLTPKASLLVLKCSRFT